MYRNSRPVFYSSLNWKLFPPHYFAAMKFLDSEKLDSLSTLLSIDADDCKIETKIEMYSCKMVNQDKRMFKEMLRAEGPQTTANDLQALSPPVDRELVFPYDFSPNSNATTIANGFGGRVAKSRHTSGGSEPDQSSEEGSPLMCDAINRKKLFDLISVLNSSFQDYDFSAARGEHFSKVATFEIVKHLIDSKFGSVAPQEYAAVQHHVWSVLNECVNLKGCKFFTYNPDYRSDPYAEDGCTWSFNFFLYNSQMKRIVFFTCRAFSHQSCGAVTSEIGDMEDEM